MRVNKKQRVTLASELNLTQELFECFKFFVVFIFNDVVIVSTNSVFLFLVKVEQAVVRGGLVGSLFGFQFQQLFVFE
jgi:hypothetical protein